MLIIIIFCLCFAQPTTKENSEPDYIPAFDFTLNLIDLDKKSNEATIQLSSLKGNVVLINFWATWCGPCIAEIPEFNELYEKYNPQKFEILGISVNDSESQLNRFIKKFPVSYKLLYGSMDDMNTVIQQYGGFNSVPVSYLINREGMIVRGYPSAIIGEYWTSMLHADILKFLADPIPEEPDTDPSDQSNY